MSLVDLGVPEVLRQACLAAMAGDEDRRWRLVHHLHRHGGRQAFQAATELCRDREATRRELGVDILGRLGGTPGRSAGQRPFRDATVRLLLDLVQTEQDPAVLGAIAIAFGHLDDARGIPPLARLRTHHEPAVRKAVAFGLLGRPERAALDVLIALCDDPAPDVRNWATFGLAREGAADFGQLRDALAQRVDDVDFDTRAEAIHGLATRGDSRAIPPLLDALAASWPGSDPSLIEEALYALAATTGDRRICAHVNTRRALWRADQPDEELPDDLRAALDRCVSTDPGQ